MLDEPPPAGIAELLDATARLHQHLCPRQVLGVRLALAAAAALGEAVPQTDKHLLAIVETDGCFTDGVAVASNCWVGRRTMRVEDYGKVALTLVDVRDGRAVRARPAAGVREAALARAPEAESRWQGQLLGYQRLPDAQLVDLAPVRLRTPVAAIVSQAGLRTRCARCGEEVMNGREHTVAGEPCCAACADGAYYEPLS
jgi:formylmethanofuran dehydrogenase subunit E